jgi:adenosine tuberculosinyltransferase
MDLQTFQDLPLAEVAQLVRSAGPKICVFPINGTRRWFLLEHPLPEWSDYAATYRDVNARRHIELYHLFFDHGVDTLLTPIFGPDLLKRSEVDARVATDGLALLATHPDFLTFYRTYQVRVRFYGDYRSFFASTPHAYLSDLFDEATAKTLSHGRHRLFFGVCAHDAAETIARLAVQYYAEQGRPPDKRALVELYYGEYVEPTDLFIGFDRFCVFDVPLVATGNEDLYFTASPSPYLSEHQLREILFDHLYSRRGGELDYAVMGPEDWRLMRDYYLLNRNKTLGVGLKRGQIWYPLPQVELPSSFE